MGPPNKLNPYARVLSEHPVPPESSFRLGAAWSGAQPPAFALLAGWGIAEQQRPVRRIYGLAGWGNSGAAKAGTAYLWPRKMGD